MRILFIAPYPTGEAPSQRFRFEQYFKALNKVGIHYDTSPFLGYAAWNVLYKPGHFLKKASALFKGYFRRLGDIFTLSRYDIVFIHREASPFGPPVFEWLITKVFRKYTVYDFDDAIWIPNASESNNKLTFRLKRFRNPASISKWATVVSAGNDFLATFARQYNSHVIVNPTTIDTEEYHNITSTHEGNKFVIGWTGSHSTVQYLDIIYPVLKRLEEKYEFEFHVICDTPPKINLKSLRFIKWTKENEISALLGFNLGIMPLPDDIWSKGKCGFKALQYMSLGIPAIVSEVGVNSQIVDHGVNGFICSTEQEWFESISKLITDRSELKKLSDSTRQKVIAKYSVSSNTPNFLSLFSLGYTLKR
jgi:glycosyltransferase involved in cell wall biosynthesis